MASARAVIAHMEHNPINIQFFHTEPDNDSHCFVLWASTYNHMEINSNLWVGENVGEIPPNMGPIPT